MSRQSAAPALVIFDCDGVLVDSEPISNRVLAELLCEIGLPTTTRESMDTYMGRTMDACLGIIEERLGRGAPDDFVARFQERRFAAFARELRPVPGIETALDEIEARGVATCVASSGMHSTMQRTLGQAGLLRRFEGRIFSATEVARSKPFPDVFLHAAERMRAAPDACVVVEDSPLGVRAGVAAGMRVLGLARDTAAARLRDEGAEVFDDLRELPVLLGLLAAPPRPA